MRYALASLSLARARGIARFVLAAVLLVSGWAAGVQAATGISISGEIERITITNQNDHWSGGTVQVGGQIVILPRNMLLDLPANRLTLKQLYDQAPAACLPIGETGLAKGDRCNTTGTGGFASISANRTSAGNVIAGDVLIQKGVEAITGTVTYISFTDGYYRLNGNLGDATTGVMVRLNDPDSRHTVQAGAGCAGGPNCSPDPRFTLDSDNYTNVFTTGYPYCIPSTVQRTVATALPALPGIPGLPAGTIAQAATDGSGDALCPQTNRPAAGPVADSRRFAPIKLGDPVTAEGNFETVNGVRFLSAHSSTIQSGLITRPDLGQPDYMFLEEVFIDMPAFQNERIRSLFIGFTTLAPADVLIWSLHYDPRTNAAHEFPLASSQGCDTAGGTGTCAATGLVVGAGDIFRIRHDIDFLVGARARLNPCAHLQSDPRMGTGICPNTALDQVAAPFNEMLGILSPIPHEIQARTGKKVASLQPGATPLVTLDINGNEATNGQYLFPFGMNLGGLAAVEPVEFDLNAVAMPFYFSGLPWALDRRLSPAGCIDTNGDGTPDCEATPQPLDPFPFEASDPRTQASVPAGLYSDPNFTASPLTDARNRIFSFVDPTRTRPGVAGIPETASGNFNGNATVLAFPPRDPALIPIAPATPVTLICTDAGAAASTPTTLPPPVTPPTAPPPVSAPTNAPPQPVNDTATTTAGLAVVISVLANDTDPDGDLLTVTAVGPAAGGTAVNGGGSLTYTPNAGFAGTDTFPYTVSDGRGGTATGSVSVTVTAVPAGQVTVTRAEFRGGNRAEWRVTGTTGPLEAVTIHLGSTLAGEVLGTAVADGAGLWTFRQRQAAAQPGTNRRISVESTNGGRVLNFPVTVR